MPQGQEWILGMDIGGTHIRCGLVNEKKDLLHYQEWDTSAVFPRDAAHPTKALSRWVENYLSQEGMPPIGGIAIGVPSTVSRDGSLVLQTPNIPAFPDYYPLKKELEAQLPYPVSVLRDVNGHLLYDLWDLAIPAGGTVAGIYFGTGIGNAIQVDGKLLSGKNGVAAELGHIPLYGQERRCSCGNKGCLETVVSGLALRRLQEECFPHTFIGALFKEHAGAAPLTHFVEHMGAAVAVEVNLLDPDFLILGGGLLQMEGFPFALLEKAIRTYSRKPVPCNQLVWRYSKAAQANGVIGAAIFARQEWNGALLGEGSVPRGPLK